MIVFCSDSHTAKGHVAVGNSAERLLEGGRTAVAIAPVDLAERVEAAGVQRIVAVGDADGGARQTAESLARALGASVEPVANEQADLLVIDSRADAPTGSRLAQLLRVAPDRDGNLPGARGAARCDAVVRLRRARAGSRLAGTASPRLPPAATSAWSGRRPSRAGYRTCARALG